ANGMPDLAFGTNGLAFAPPLPGGSARDVAVQPDQKIVLVGTVPSDDFAELIAVARFLPDGQPDPDFGADGIAAIGLGAGRKLEANAVVVEPDGRILAAGDEFDVNSNCGLVQ